MALSPLLSRPILIAGGGIGGLSAALALAQQGFACHVLERSGEFTEIGAGVQLGPNANRVLGWLGLTAALEKVIVAIEELRLMDGLNDGHLASVPLGETVRKRFGAPYCVVHRADLHKALLEACKGHRLVTLETHRAVERFEAAGDRVVVHTELGGRYVGQALIGADGLWSTVRQQLLDDGKPRFTHHTCFRALLNADQMPEALRWNAATLWTGPNAHLVHYPVSAGARYSIVATYASGEYREGWNGLAEREELMQHFRRFAARPRQLIERASTWRRWSLCDRLPAERWCDGRVALMGDAAHPMLQYFAQGAAMAMEDAISLAVNLKGYEGDIERGFRAYERERIPRTTRAQSSAIDLGRMYHARGLSRFWRNWRIKTTRPERILDRLAWCFEGP